MRLQLKYLLSTRNWPSYPATAIAGILFSADPFPPRKTLGGFAASSISYPSSV